MQNGNQIKQRGMRFNTNKSDNQSGAAKGAGRWVQQKNDFNSERANNNARNEKKPKVISLGNKNIKAPPPPPTLKGNIKSRISMDANERPKKNYKNDDQNNDVQDGGNRNQRDTRDGDNRGRRRNNRDSNPNYKFGGGYPYFGQNERIKDRVNKELSGPQLDLPVLSVEERKFNSQCRLFIGNIPRDANTDELKEMFSKYGEIDQVYFNLDSAFGFVSYDYKHNALKAVREMQGKSLLGRSLTVRFAAVSTGIRVKNLSPFVSNELLEKAFNVFGAVENVRVIVDSRGKPNGEGIIIFSDKKSASTAIKLCEKECYFLTSSLRPVIAEPLDAGEEGEGYPETAMNKNEMYRKEREMGPHFADSSSFQYEYGLRWKQLFSLFSEKKAALERDFSSECDALAAKLSLVKHEYETECLRRELAAREAESSYLQAEAQYRMNSSTTSFSQFHEMSFNSSTGGDGGFNNFGDNNQSSFGRNMNQRSNFNDGFDNQQFSNYNGNQRSNFDNSQRSNFNNQQMSQGNDFNQHGDNFDQTYSNEGNNDNQQMNAQEMTTSTPAISSKLANRLQKFAEVEPEPPVVELDTNEEVSTKPVGPYNTPGINSTKRTVKLNKSGQNDKDLSQTLSSRQNTADLSQTLSSRQGGQDLSRSLSSRQGDLNQGLTRRHDRSHDQGSFQNKRMRY